MVSDGIWSGVAWGRELRKGALDMAILVFLSKEGSHGYALIQRLQHAGIMPEEGAQATVYQALQRLAKEDLLQAAWTTPGPAGRPRKEYQITPAGKRALAAMRDDWGAFAHTVHDLLGDDE